MLDAQPVSKGIYRNRFIQVITMSTVFLHIGIWVRNFAILLFIMERTNNNPYAVSLISVAEFAPIFVFSFIGGTFADRWRPKRTMVWCDALSAVSVFIVLLAIIFGTWQGVFFVTLVSAILSQFSQPSAMKLFKVHLPGEQLQQAMAVFQTVIAVFMIIGPVLGTFIYQKFGINFAVGVMGAAFLLSAGVLVFLPHDQLVREKPETNFWRQLAGGFSYVWARKVLAVLGGVFLVAGLGVGVITPMGVFVVTERLGLPKESLQWLMATNGAAMILGAGIVMGFAKKIAPQKLLAVGFLVSAITIVGIGLSTNLLLTLVLQFFSGLIFPCIHVAINTLILRTADEEFVGRVNGVLSPLFAGGMVTAMSLSGWLKAQLSLVTIYEISGALFFVGVLLVVPLFKVVIPQRQGAV